MFERVPRLHSNFEKISTAKLQFNENSFRLLKQLFFDYSTLITLVYIYTLNIIIYYEFIEKERATVGFTM